MELSPESAEHRRRDPLRVLFAGTLVVVPACLTFALAGPLALAFFIIGTGSVLAAYGVLQEEQAAKEPIEPLRRRPRLS